MGEPPKVAERLAARIVDDIARAGWPVGRVLGTEPALLEHYGVSRNAFREAVRLLEHLNAARMREGRGGGLMVTQPQPGPVAHAAAIYLRYDGVDVAELYDARMDLELRIVERAVERIDDDGRTRLRALLADEARDVAADEIPIHTRTLHMALAEVAGNRPMALFLDTLISLSDEYSRPELAARGPDASDALASRLRDSQRAHAAIAKAVIDGDAATATRRMRTHLGAVARWMP
jgi:DNA-binding FadR family transcriptional regulator